MKAIFWLVILFLFSIKIYSQAELEKEYPLENIQYFYVTDSSGVYVNYSIYSQHEIILLYDDNHQSIKFIKPPNDSILSIINVSKYLVNEDSRFEIIYVYQTIMNGSRHYNTRIIDENGNIIESFNDQFMWLMSTAGGTKLISQGGVRIYSLPGINYPVSRGEKGERGERGALGLQGIKGEKGDQGEKGDKGNPGNIVIESDCNCPDNPPGINVIASIFLSEPYPNPSQYLSTIDYNIYSDNSDIDDFPTSFIVFYDTAGLQRLRLLLVHSAGSVEINKSLLGTGIFLFRIETASGASELKKLIFE